MRIGNNRTLRSLRTDVLSDSDAIEASSFGKIIVKRRIGRSDADAISEYIYQEQNDAIEADDLFDPYFVRKYYPSTIVENESTLAFICRFAEKPWCYPTELRVLNDASVIRNSSYFDEAYLRRQINAADATLDLAIYYCTEGFRYNLNPSTRFLVLPYMIDNTDLGAAECSGLLHYEAIGRSEGRRAYGAATVEEIFGAYLLSTDLGNGGVRKGALIHAARGGLMNRLIPVLSTMIEAEKCNRNPIVCWPPDEHCAAHFDDLFDMAFYGPQRLSSRHLPIGPADFWINHWDMHNLTDFPASEAPSLIVQSVSAFSSSDNKRINYTTYAAAWNCLAYAAPVQKMLSDAPKIHRECSIGLHVRRPYENGFEAALENSKFKVPLDRYIDVVRRIQAAFPALTNIFLCSNSPSAERELSSQLPRVSIREKQSYDNTSDHVAVQEALVDSILLSRCQIVISQEASSFGYFASIVSGGICIFILNNNDDPATEIFYAGSKIATVKLDDNFERALAEHIHISKSNIIRSNSIDS